jgi:hypothetical protein
LTVEQIFPLKEILTEYDIKLVLYVRRQDQAMQGLYQTIVTNQGYGKSFDDFFVEYAEYFDYNKIIEQWKTVFPYAEVIIRVYEKQNLNNGNSIDDFFALLEQILNLEIDKKGLIRINGEPNFSYPDYVTNLLCFYNANQNMPAFDNVILKISRYLYTKRRTGDYEIISPIKRQNILDYFSTSNSLVSAVYLNKSDSLFSNLQIIQPQQEWFSKLGTFESNLFSFLSDIDSYWEGGVTQSEIIVDDKQADVFRNQALTFIESEEWEAALEKLKLAYSIRPHGPYIRLLLIQAFIKLNRLEEISNHLEFLKNPPSTVTDDVSLNNLLNQLRYLVVMANNFDAVRSVVINNKDNESNAAIKRICTFQEINLNQVKNSIIKFIDIAKQNLILNDVARLEQSIPKVSHRIWLTDPEYPHEPPFDFIERYLNNLVDAYPPDWKHYFWIQDEALIPKTIEFIKHKKIRNLSVKHFRKELSAGNWLNLIDTFIKDKKFVFAGDILRLKIMDEVGGVYCDLGVNFLPGYVDYLTKHYDCILIYWHALFFQNSLLAMKPNNKLSNYFMKITESPYIVPKEILFNGEKLDEGILFAGPLLTMLLLDIGRAQNYDLRLSLLHPVNHVLSWQSNKSWYQKDENNQPKFGNAYIPDALPSFLNEKMFGDFHGDSIFDLIEESETK